MPQAKSLRKSELRDSGGAPSLMPDEIPGIAVQEEFNLQHPFPLEEVADIVLLRDFIGARMEVSMNFLPQTRCHIRPPILNRLAASIAARERS